MEQKPIVKFYYVKNEGNAYPYFNFLGETFYTNKEMDEKTVDITKFNGTNNCLPCKIILYDKMNDSIEFIINIYKSENIFYLFLKEKGMTYELIFLNCDNIIINGIYNKFDTNHNKNRKRITLINYNSYYMKVNGNDFCTSNYISYIKNDSDSVITSVQFSFYTKDLIIAKKNELMKQKLNIEDFYNKNNNNVQDFYNSLKNILINFDKTKIESLISNYKKIYKEYLKFNFCLSKEELNDIFAPKYHDFFYKILILKLIINKKDIINNKENLKFIINSFNKFNEIVKTDDKLKAYQRIFCLIEYCYFVKKYDYYELSYTLCNYADKNSAIDKSLKFYKKFISELDEDSPVFFKFLEINSKYGYYKGDEVFNFNLLNVEDIKQHLLDLIPEIIFFYDLDEQKSCSKAVSLEQTGEIAINTFYLFKNNNKCDISKEYTFKEDINNVDNIAMTIWRILFHETGGHTKFRNKANIKNGTKSPVRCVLEGKIKKLTYLYDKGNSNDLIKILPNDKNGRGDSGHLLETSLGKYNGEYVINYFDKIKNIGNLLSYPEYFAKKEKIKTLDEYIYLKNLAEENNINIKENSQWEIPLEKYIPIIRKAIDNKLLDKQIKKFSQKTEKEKSKSLLSLLCKKRNSERKNEKESSFSDEGNNSSDKEKNLNCEKKKEKNRFKEDDIIDLEEKQKEDKLEQKQIKVEKYEKFESSDSEACG